MVWRHVRRALLAFGALSTLSIVPASAQTPTPNSNYSGCSAFASDVTVVPGQTITISGSGANPGDRVTATMGPTAAHGTADADGNFSFSATIAASARPGTQTLTVTCGLNGGDAQITMTVSQPEPTPTSRQPPGSSPAPGGNLPRTGGNGTIPLAKLGVLLVAVGGLLVAGSRRRRWARDSPVTG